MRTERIQAFSDGVFAIIITIMVLELAAPPGPTWHDLARLWPKALSYVLSFVYVGIYWNNHHHVFQAVRKVSGAALWANLTLLFSLSFLPLATAWAGDQRFAPAPMAFWCIVAFAAALTYTLLVDRLIRADEANSRLARATASGTKEKASMAVYLVGVVAPFVLGELGSLISFGALTIVALVWVIPDRRIERVLAAENDDRPEGSRP